MDRYPLTQGGPFQARSNALLGQVSLQIALTFTSTCRLLTASPASKGMLNWAGHGHSCRLP